MIMNDSWYREVYGTRATELADIAAMDRLARDLAPESSLRRYAEGVHRVGWLTRLARWGQRRRHVRHAV